MVIQSIDRAAQGPVVAAGRPAPRHHRARRRARPAAVDGARHRQVAPAARPGGQGAQRQSLHARPGAAQAPQRLPRHPRRARARDALDAGAGSPHRPRRRGSAPSSSTRSSSSTTTGGRTAASRCSRPASPSRRTPPRWARCCSPTTRVRRRRGADRSRCAASPATPSPILPSSAARSSPRSPNAASRPRRTRPCSASRRSRHRSSTRAARSSPPSPSCSRRASGRPRTTCSTTCARPRATSPASSGATVVAAADRASDNPRARYSAAMTSRMRAAVSLGVLPTLTPAASRASFFAWAVPGRAGDDRARVTHGLALGRGEARDVADDRLGDVRLDEVGRALLGVAADLADHDDRLRLGVGLERASASMCVVPMIGSPPMPIAVEKPRSRSSNIIW